MKLPHDVYSHCLAHGPELTPDRLLETLPHDRSFGYGGQVIVPALADPQQHATIVDTFERSKTSALVCGFMAGNGPDPLDTSRAGTGAAGAALGAQMRLARAFHRAGIGPNGIVGPIHTHHMAKRARFDREALAEWINTVAAIQLETGLDWVAFEPLNDTEDGTPDPFNLLAELLRPYPKLGLQWDTGHAHSRGLTAKDMVDMATSGVRVFYLELANVGRSPLDVARGIDFEAYAAAARDHLPDSCIVGVEPFDLSVIQAFGLQKLCDTTTAGVEALARDAETLRRLGFLPERA